MTLPLLTKIGGLSWKNDGALVHNPNRRFTMPDSGLVLPYEKLGDTRRYLGRTFLGRRTASHQAAIGCRFRCTFCGVAAMFGGASEVKIPSSGFTAASSPPTIRQYPTWRPQIPPEVPAST